METTAHTSTSAPTIADTLLLNLDEVARELRCARRSVERQIARHRLTVVHVGRSVRVERRELGTWADGRTGPWRGLAIVDSSR